jgi:hypothetical protein
MNEFSINSVVVCDDIRKEITNKDILIGVYGGGLLVPQLPAAMPIAIWIELTPHTAGTLAIDIKIVLPGTPGEIRLQLIGNVSVVEEPTSVSTPQIMCPVGAEGYIEISVRPVGSDGWAAVKKRRVSVSPPEQPPKPMEIQIGFLPTATVSSPTASQPPSEQSPFDVPESKPPSAPRRRRFRPI